MIQRLIRIGVALAVAFVFTGRMEAATAHCARLAAAERAAIEPSQGALPCHGMDDARTAPEAPDDPAPHDPAPHGPAPHGPAPHDPAQSKCECIAVLAGFASFAPAVTSAHIEPYEWMLPPAVTFASVDPSPGLRPPRA